MQEPPPRADAIVVLGCRVRPAAALRGAAARRVARAARAYHEGVAPRVLACGGRRWEGEVECRAMTAELRRLGVPDEALLLEERSCSTVENALFAAPILRGLGARTLALVTCRWHLPRASSHFAAMGFVTVELGAEAPPAGPWVRTRRRVREAIASWLDARTLARRGGAP